MRCLRCSKRSLILVQLCLRDAICTAGTTDNQFCFVFVFVLCGLFKKKKKKRTKTTSQVSVPYLILLLWHLSHDVPRFPTSGFRQLGFDRRGDRTRRHLSALMNIQLQLHLPRINFGFWQNSKTQSESDGGESVDSPAAAVTVSQPQERFNILGCRWIALV